MPVAIVTGGNSGIGKAISVALAGQGFDIGITWHEAQDKLEEAIEECRAHGVRVEARQMDVDAADPRELPARVAPIDELIEALGGIDAFVNNAGGGGSTPFLQIELEEFLRVVNLNLTSAFLCCQRAARAMVEQGRGGRIVVITSVHEHQPLDGSTPYVAAKHGAGGMVKNMAIELAEHGISVNAVAPGEIATRMTGQEDQDPSETRREGIPYKRPGDAREIAAAVAFLVSPDGRYTNGHSLVVDGGMLQMGPMANQIAG